MKMTARYKVLSEIFRKILTRVLTAFKWPLKLLLEVLLLSIRIFFILLWRVLQVFVPRSFRTPDGALQADLVLVTGSGNGLSRQIALKLAEMGASLVLWDNDREAIRALAEEAESYGIQVYPFVCDCSDRDAIHQTAMRVQKEVGNISILVNNLSITNDTEIMNQDETKFGRGMKTNFSSNYWTIKAFLPWMVHNDYGYIVNVVTQPLFCGLSGNADHAAAKAAVLAFSEALCSELFSLNKTGVHVTCVCPWERDYDPSELPKLAEQVIEAMMDHETFVTLPRYKFLLIILKCEDVFTKKIAMGGDFRPTASPIHACYHLRYTASHLANELYQIFCHSHGNWNSILHLKFHSGHRLHHRCVLPTPVLNNVTKFVNKLKR